MLLSHVLMTLPIWLDHPSHTHRASLIICPHTSLERTFALRQLLSPFRYLPLPLFFFSPPGNLSESIVWRGPPCRRPQNPWPHNVFTARSFLSFPGSSIVWGALSLSCGQTSTALLQQRPDSVHESEEYHCCTYFLLKQMIKVYRPSETFLNLQAYRVIFDLIHQLLSSDI